MAWWLLPADAPDLADWSYMPGLPHVGLITVTLLVFLVNGYGEETGWRGFAIPRMRESHGPLAASLILAVAWAVWHVPTFWLDSAYRGFEPLLIPGFFIGMAAGSIVFTWIAEGSGWSIPILALVHAALNMGSATEATQSGPIAVATTTLIIFWAVRTVHVWREEGGRR